MERPSFSPPPARQLSVHPAPAHALRHDLQVMLHENASYPPQIAKTNAIWKILAISFISFDFLPFSQNLYSYTQGRHEVPIQIHQEPVSVEWLEDRDVPLQQKRARRGQTTAYSGTPPTQQHLTSPATHAGLLSAGEYFPYHLQRRTVQGPQKRMESQR